MSLLSPFIKLVIKEADSLDLKIDNLGKRMDAIDAMIHEAIGLTENDQARRDLLDVQNLLRTINSELVYGFGMQLEEIAWLEMYDQLSLRTINSLRNQGVNTVEQLQSLTARQVISFRGLGVKCFKEISDMMKRDNRSFRREL